MSTYDEAAEWAEHDRANGEGGVAVSAAGLNWTPSMTYTDDHGHKRRLTYVQAVCLTSIGRGERMHCSTTSISTRTAFALAEGGLIYLDGLYGDWTINGITPRGEQVAAAYEAKRKSLMKTG